MSKQAFDRKLDQIEALRADPSPVNTLRKALADRNNYLVAKAAAIAAGRGLDELIPDLAAAFQRFLLNPVKSDPQCWAKNAIVKALKDLDYPEPDFFVRGLCYRQREPCWTGSDGGGRGYVDTATTLRGESALALVMCPLPRSGILTHLVDALGDPEKPVRVEAARAIAQLAGPDSLLLLRLKAICGDRESEVVGQCFAGMLAISPVDSIAFIASFLDLPEEDAAIEAAAALGESNDPAALQILREKWSAHKDPGIRRAILLSLGGSRLQSAAEFLLTVVADGPSEDASHAIRALAAGRFRDEFRTRVTLILEARANLRPVFEREFRSVTC